MPSMHRTGPRAAGRKLHLILAELAFGCTFIKAALTVLMAKSDVLQIFRLPRDH